MAHQRLRESLRIKENRFFQVAFSRAINKQAGAILYSIDDCLMVGYRNRGTTPTPAKKA